ncbi:MAG: hypothetical protein IMZ52_05565 [Actinobacteria bacterium]|nr:hypothetical protein [Actinomycetota bacterium]MBE3128838.1 hypothetical protein [Actinomycetota bacterium]
MKGCITFAKEEYLGIKIKVYFGLNSRFYTNVTNDKGYEWSRLALDAAKKKIDFDLVHREKIVEIQTKRGREIITKKFRIKKEIAKPERQKRIIRDRHVDVGGYVLLLRKNHPFAKKDGYVCEHRLIMEEWLRINDPNCPALIEINGMKYLRREWIVHHRNHIRNDNRPENLLAIEKNNHGKEGTKKKFMEFLEHDPSSVIKMREDYLQKHPKYSKK